ncbi:hypothetical protein D3C72_815140 [compost metagenome]
MEEIRPIIRSRTHVELVARQELRALAGQQGLRRFEEPGPVEQVVAVRLGHGHPGVVGQVEGARPAELPQHGDAGVVEIPVADQQRRGLPAADHDDAARRAGLPVALDGRGRGGQQPGNIARRQGDPAGDGQQAAGREMAQVLGEGIHRVQVVLGQRMQAARGSAEGVQQGDLDQVVRLAARSHQAARLADQHTDVGRAVRLAGEVGEAALDQIDHLRVQFDGIHRAGVVVDRLQHIGAGAAAQHQHAGLAQQVIGQS